MQVPRYNYPSLGFSCHWHAICQQYAACTGIIEALENNEEKGIMAAQEDMKRLRHDLEKAKTDHQREVINKDLERLRLISPARKLLVLTLRAAHEDGAYREYACAAKHTIQMLVHKLYDINIFMPDMIMLDSAKLYEYCIKYFAPKELLYVSTTNDSTSLENIVRKYEPKYILIPCTELGARLEMIFDDTKYNVISVTKGSGHFYCDHIVDNKAYQFDDMSPREMVRTFPASRIESGIAKSEIKDEKGEVIDQSYYALAMLMRQK